MVGARTVAGRAALGLAFASLLVAATVLAGGMAGAADSPQTGIVCTEGTGVPGAPVFDLTALDGYISTPDGNSVYMWGFAPRSEDFQMPGPTLCVREGDRVKVRLTNHLDVPVSMIFPGQLGVISIGGSPGLLAAEVDPCAGPPCPRVVYTFHAEHPGTYLYESGTKPHKQVQMGLYGAIVVRPAMGDNFAYDDPTTEFDPDREFLLLIHDIDPDLHRAVELGHAYHVTRMHDRYWTINGRSFPDTIADNGVPWLPVQPYGALVQVEASPDTDVLPALIRYANAGMVNHPFHPHGNHLRVIGRDGRELRGAGGRDLSQESFTKTIGSGQTYEALFRWVNVDAWDPVTNPIPVRIPRRQNLVFKDDVTFYSGKPYLGRQGALPPGVTSYNECGEFYFPWHSHALNEFQNFDEGFGGLATLVRVDPPGGC
jgi:FtsP/CotA-like multicopper oxidase with cupredoxin domain